MAQFHREQPVYVFEDGRELRNVITSNVKGHLKNSIKDRVQKVKDAFREVKLLLPRERKKDEDKRDKEVSEFVGNTNKRDDQHDFDDCAGGH
ncbi:hypothetical protein ACHAP8_001132 [Fusarium lateritium]